MINDTVCVPTNVCSPCSTESDKKEYDTNINAIFASYIVVLILSPVAVAGNSLILAAIWKKRTPFHRLLSGLAFADLCTGLITQPCLAASFLMCFTNPGISLAQPILVTATSIIGTASMVYFGAVTLFTITLMSVERWLYMTRRSLVTSRRGFLVAWAILFLIPIPMAVISALNIITGASGTPLNIVIVTFIFFCYLTTFVTSFKVFRIIRQHQQRVRTSQSSQHFGQPAINIAKYKKSVLSILYVLALFSFCFLPLIASVVAYALLGNLPKVEAAFRVSLVPLFLSSSLNPVLYLWRLDSIRNGVKQLLR